MNNPKVSSLVHNSPTSSSPLRKSINGRNISLTNISENDDEAERISRRRVQATSTSSSSSVVSGPSNRRHSLSSAFLANIPASKMAECINECIRLSTENKINTKNAFNLELIDFMTYMIKKQDVNMSSLQVASTSLDVSSKIYGFRVDSVHAEILKIIGGLDKQTTDENAGVRSDEDGETADEDAAGDKEELKQKKKNKRKQNRKIIATAEALAGRVEIVKPTSVMIDVGDQQTSDMLSLASLPNHAASGFYLHPYNDVLVDVIEDTSESQSNDTQRCNIPAIEDFSNLEVCESYANFEFLNWSVDNEPDEMEMDESGDNENDNRFQFDLNASVEHDDDPAPEPMNYFDIEHDDENKENDVHGCYRAVGNRPNENIRPVHSASANIASEYSFVQPNLHWAGPSHWKFRNFARMSSAVKMTACKQGPLRKRKQIELSYDDNNDVIDAKFAPGNSNKLPSKTARLDWLTEAITLPEDTHYDRELFFKLYIHERVFMNTENTNNERNGAINLDMSDNERYDYNNPNDTMEYCPGVNNGDYDEGGADECNLENDAAAVLNTQNFIGDNLVAAPKLANKVLIPYCVKAKKIDMRQLKKSLWKCLRSKSDVDVDVARDEENEGSTMETSKKFSNVYKVLPKVLTKSNAEALSAPMAFLSLLHLANEQELSLSSTSDLSDIVIAPSEEDTNEKTE